MATVQGQNRVRQSRVDHAVKVNIETDRVGTTSQCQYRVGQGRVDHAVKVNIESDRVGTTSQGQYRVGQGIGSTIQSRSI